MLSRPFASIILLTLLASVTTVAGANEPLSPIKPADATSKKEKICAIYPHLK
ncbi:TMAO reductase system protein TorT, partial [Vibrio coralliirubri]